MIKTRGFDNILIFNKILIIKKVNFNHAFTFLWRGFTFLMRGKKIKKLDCIFAADNVKIIIKKINAQ